MARLGYCSLHEPATRLVGLAKHCPILLTISLQQQHCFSLATLLYPTQLGIPQALHHVRLVNGCLSLFLTPTAGLVGSNPIPLTVQPSAQPCLPPVVATFDDCLDVGFLWWVPIDNVPTLDSNHLWLLCPL